MKPMLEDRMVGWSGRATKRAAPGPQKHYATATARTRTQACRHMQGSPHSPAFKGLRYVDQLARGEHTSPWPQITEEIGVAKRVEFEGVEDTEILRARLHELMAGEHARQAAQDAALQIAALTRDYSGVHEACMPHADALVEIAHLAEEIADRDARGR